VGGLNPHPRPGIPTLVRIAREIRAQETRLLAIASKLCRNRDEARDLVQDVYERALRSQGHLRPDSNVGGWLLTILHNLFIDRCRARAARPALVPIAEDSAAAAAPPVEPSPIWDAITPEDVRVAVTRLPEEFRSVFSLYEAGRSYEEIARELAIPKSTVGTRMIRARAKLRTLLLPLVAPAASEVSR